MKWLHVIGHLRTGGVELRLMRTIRALGRRYAHSILSLDGSREALDLFPEVAEQVHFVEPAPPPAEGAIATMKRVGRLAASEDPDAVLTYGWGAFDAVLWSVLSRSKIPCFHHEDGFTAAEVRQMPRRRELARRLALPRIAATIVPSKGLASMCETKWRVAPNRIVFAPNGVEPDPSTSRMDVRARFQIPPATPIAMAVGRLARVKRMDRAIDAAAGAGVALVILGDGPEENALRRRAAERQGSVHFAGLQPDVREWLRGADIYLSTSASEQHPLAMLEAMDEGLPVVATDVGDVVHSLPSAQRAYALPADHPVRTGATTLAELGQNAALRSALGEANRAHIQSHYRFETALARVERAILDRCPDESR